MSEYNRIIQDASEANDLELTMKTSDALNILSVFVKVPSNQQQFIYKRIKMKEPVTNHFENMSATVLDYALLDLAPYTQTPIPQDTLEKAIEKIKKFEQVANEEAEFRDIAASVAVAEYKGSKEMTIEGLIPLIVAKYQKMRLSRN